MENLPEAIVLVTPTHEGGRVMSGDHPMTKPDELTREQLIADMKVVRAALASYSFHDVPFQYKESFMDWKRRVSVQAGAIAEQALAATDRPEYKEVE